MSVGIGVSSGLESESSRVVERTFAWLGQSRRRGEDDERLPAVCEAMIHGAVSRLMLRRLTHRMAEPHAGTVSKA